MENPFESDKGTKKHLKKIMQSNNYGDFSFSDNLYDQLNQKYLFKYDTLFKVLNFISLHKWTICVLLFLFTDNIFLIFFVIFEEKIVEWLFETIID